MKVGKSSVQVPVQKLDGAYYIYETVEQMLDGEDFVAELCAKMFETMTGIAMKDTEYAMVTLEVTKADLVTKKASYTLEKVK